MGITWGRAAQLHPNPHPSIPTLSLPTTSIPRADSLKSQLPVQDTHPPLGAGAGSSIGVVHVEAGESSHASPAAPRGDRDGLRHPSGKHPAFHPPASLDGGCAECPRRGCSARGDNDRRCHLLIPGGMSHHGNVHVRHRVALPGEPVEGRGASTAFQGFSLESTGALENSSLGFGTLTSSSSSKRPRFQWPAAPGILWDGHME